MKTRNQVKRYGLSHIERPKYGALTHYWPKEILKAQKAELEASIKASLDATVNVPMLERFIEDMQSKLPDLDFEGKRLALDMLDITVWLDGDSVEITGTIDLGIVLTPSYASYSPWGLKSPLVPLFQRGKLGWGKTTG